MAICKTKNIQQRSNKKLCHPKRRDNFTFLKSNYKYKRRYEMELRNQSQRKRVNRFTTTKTITTDIAIREECNSINELISGNAVAARCSNDGNKWRKRAHNAYATLLRVLLLITGNLKPRVHHKLTHHHNAKGKSMTVDRNIQGIKSGISSGLGVGGGVGGGLVTDSDVNIDKDETLKLNTEKVLTTPLTTATTTSARSSTTTSTRFCCTALTSILPGTMASFVCSRASAPPLSSTTPLPAATSSTKTTTTTITLSSLLPLSTLCDAVRFNDKLFAYLSALFIALALCARGAAGGACWQTALNNGKCNQLYSMNITRAECCGRSPDFSFTERDPSDVEYFFATAIGGGMECSPCIESCKNVECASNKKCVKRKGRPKCICAPECGKAARRRRARQRAKHYRGHLQHHSEQMPRDIRSLSSEITNFNLGLNANGDGGSSDGAHTSNLENHRNQNQRKTKQHMQSQHNEGNEQQQLIAASGSTTNQTRQQQSTKNQHKKNCRNQNHNHVNNGNSSNINCKSSQQQQQNINDNAALAETQTEAFLFKSAQLDRHQQHALGRHQKNKRKQRLHHQRQQQQQHHHYHQHQHRHHSNTQTPLERELKKHKFKDHQQQTTMTMLRLPVNGATSYLPTSSVASIYNTTTATTKIQPHLSEQQTSSSSSSSSSSSLGTPANSTTSLPSIFVVAADRHHLLNRGSIFTTSSLSTASQPLLAVSSSTRSSLARQQKQHQQQQLPLPPPSAFFTAISKVPLSSSAVEIPSVSIVGVGSNTSPASTKTHVNADLALFNIPGLANEQNENVHIDVISHTAHPVCGTDGRTYNSECQLKKRACRTNNSNLKVAYRGHCKTTCNGVKCLNGLMCVEDHYMTPHCIPCKIQCPQDDDEDDEEEPIVNDYERNFNKKTSQQQKTYMRRTGIDPKRAVCGVDGKTYKSTCDINRMICKIGHAIAVAYPGPCRDDRITCNEINCGSKHKCLVDLLTHEPRCVSCSYKCSRKQHATLQSHRYENGKICGVNNRTYNSWCEMRKDSCTTGFFIDVKAVGKCQ